tara:strand:- start:330 stop:611 length:282 start_codon:yes stop_codon:yes gene_type:complete
MNIKNSFIVLIGLFALIYGNIKDLTYPGYNRLYYYTEYQSSKLSHLDKIVAELPKHKDINIQTNYGNKYSIELQLNNTIIMHKNGSRVYSTNK